MGLHNLQVRLLHIERQLQQANARKEFGVNTFTKVLDYVILFIMLIYLEDKTRGDKFILSELIEYIKNTAVTLKLEHIPNWDNASDRRSLIRIIDYLIGLNVIFLRDQDSKSSLVNVFTPNSLRALAGIFSSLMKRS